MALKPCTTCGKSIPESARICPFCATRYEKGTGAVVPQKKNRFMESMPGPVRKYLGGISFPLIGGLFIILGGIIELVIGLMILFFSSVVDFALDIAGETGLGGIAENVQCCGGFLAMIGVIAIVGGFFALTGRFFYAAIASGILSMGGAFVPGLIGLIFIVLGRDQFED